MGSVAIFKGKLVKFLAKAGILVPARPDSDRSITPAAGETAFNTTANKLEVYNGTSWEQLSAGGGGTGNGLVHPTTNSTFEYGSFNVSMTGQQNTAVGVSSGTSVTSGTRNAGFGYRALQILTTGSDNTAHGSFSVQNITTGNDNTGVGSFSLSNALSSSSQNTAVGKSALQGLLSGTSNVGIGESTGLYVNNGSYNTFINTWGHTATSVISGAVAIGKDGLGTHALATGNNQFVLGVSSHRYYMPGKFESDILIGSLSGTPKSIKFYDSDESNSVGFKAASNIASDVTWTLPAADGTTNQVLTTNGSGTLSWSTLSAVETNSSTSIGSISNKTIILTAATAITATDIINCDIYVQNDVALNVTGNITNSRIFSATPSTAYTGGVATLSATSTFNFTGRGIVGTYIYWAQDININTTNRVDILESQIKCARYVNDNNNFVRVINANTTVEAQRYTHNGTSTLSISNSSTVIVSDFLLVSGFFSINSGSGLKCSQLFDTGSSIDINNGWINVSYYERTSGNLSFTVQNSSGFARIGYFQNLGTVTASSLRSLSEGTLTIGCLRTTSALSVSTSFSGTLTVNVIHNTSSTVNTAPANSRNFVSHNDSETWLTAAGVWGTN